MKKIISVLIILIFIFSFISFSKGFENNKENIITTPEGSKTFIPYTKGNIDSGKLKGGHDTLTAEGMLLKEQIHNQTDWMVEQILKGEW
ncbi:MAG: hypothetical protein QME78_04560 [Thermodesulfobacteriota bacterium]|nr:hypothetical protein [Thermodesulfobacteriota bacterium]